MKRKSLTIFPLVIIGLFMVSYMIPLVSGSESLLQSVFGNLNVDIPTFISNSFGYNTTNNVGLAISTFLMIFIVVMLVYTVLDSIKIFPNNKDWVNWVVSIGVGILSFLFVTPETIKSLTAQYEALGVTIVTIIPAVIVLFFSAKIKSKLITGRGNPLLENLVSTIIPLIYLFYLWFYKFPYTFTPVVKAIHVIITIFIILFVLFGTWLIKIATKYKVDQGLAIATVNTKSNALTAALRRIKNAMKDFADATNDTERTVADTDYRAAVISYRHLGGKGNFKDNLI